MCSRLASFFLLLFCTLSLSACDDICPIVWSPDGNQMAFLSSDGLRFGDATGQLSASLLNNVSRAAWLPDSKGMLVVTIKDLITWSQVKNFLSQPEQNAAIELSQYLKEQILLHDNNDSTGSEDKFQSYSAPVRAAACLYLKDDQDSALQRKLHSEPFKLIEDTKCTIYNLNLLELTNNTITTRKDLWHNFNAIQDMRIAPDGKYALLVISNENSSQPYDILLVSLDYPRPITKVAESAAAHADWSADSKDIYLVKSGSYKDSPAILGSISSLKLIDKEGFPLQNIEASIPLVYSAIDSSLNITSLKDGQILFTAPSIELPTTNKDVSQNKNVFIFKTTSQIVRRLMSKQDAEYMHGISSIQANPAGTWIAAYNAEQGNLDLINTSTEEVIQEQAEPHLIPHWRNSDEVCFIKPKEKQTTKQHIAQVILLSVTTKNERVISESWPQAAVAGLLTHKK